MTFRTISTLKALSLAWGLITPRRRDDNQATTLTPFWCRGRILNKMSDQSQSEAEAYHSMVAGLASRWPALTLEMFNLTKPVESTPEPWPADWPIPLPPEPLVCGNGDLTIHLTGELLPNFPIDDYERKIGQASGQITLMINSPGGCADVGLRLYRALARKPARQITANVVGLCGSAATYGLMAAGERNILEGSTIFVHRNSSAVYGDADQLRKSADDLDAMLPEVRALYCRWCPPLLVARWLSGGDHLFDATQACAAGIGTDVIKADSPPILQGGELKPQPTAPPDDPDFEVKELARDLLWRVRALCKSKTSFEQVLAEFGGAK